MFAMKQGRFKHAEYRRCHHCLNALGEEYQDYPNETQISQARHLASLGCDIIIGHHPHVIQPVDLLENEDGRNTFVMYSLGNFLSDQKGLDRLIGMGASLDIRKDESGNISLENFRAKCSTVIKTIMTTLSAFVLGFEQ